MFISINSKIPHQMFSICTTLRNKHMKPPILYPHSTSIKTIIEKRWPSKRPINKQTTVISSVKPNTSKHPITSIYTCCITRISENPLGLLTKQPWCYLLPVCGYANTQHNTTNNKHFILLWGCCFSFCSWRFLMFKRPVSTVVSDCDSGGNNSSETGSRTLSTLYSSDHS